MRTFVTGSLITCSGLCAPSTSFGIAKEEGISSILLAGSLSLTVSCIIKCEKRRHQDISFETLTAELSFSPEGWT
jgi:hypothetical protein